MSSLRQRLLARSGWVIPYADWDADFVNRRYWKGGTVHKESLFACTRSTAAYAQWADGHWSSFPANTLRITDLGLLDEASQTNSLRNASMTGAVNGNTGTTPTNWNAPAASGSGLARTVGGVGGTLQGLPSITLRAQGTTSATNYTAMGFEQPTQIAAANGDNWAGSVILAIAAGDLTNITSVQLRIVERNSSGTLLASTAQTIVPTTTPQRFTVKRTLNQATTAFVTLDVVYNFSSGVAVDVTMQVAADQLEKGVLVTSPIISNGAASTRAADAITLASGVPMSLAGGSFFAEWQDVQGPVSQAMSIIELAVDANNLVHMSAHSSSNNAAFFVEVASSFTAQLLSDTTVTAGAIYRGAAAWGTDDFAAAFTAALKSGTATDISGAVPTGAFATYVCSNSVGASHLNGYLRRLAWTRRRIANENLRGGWAQAV